MEEREDGGSVASDDRVLEQAGGGQEENHYLFQVCTYNAHGFGEVVFDCLLRKPETGGDAGNGPVFELVEAEDFAGLFR